MKKKLHCESYDTYLLSLDEWRSGSLQFYKKAEKLQDWIDTLLPRIQVHTFIYAAESMVHVLQWIQICQIFGDGKNILATDISASYNCSNLPSSRKDPCTGLLFHSSIRFKTKRNCFRLVSLCIASFWIVREGMFLNFYF